jgi:DNA-3-methyladenine glycosylase I
MIPENHYCKLAASLPPLHVHTIYHDQQYGFPIDNDNELFGRLILEINQAGLSWTTILNKQENFRIAFQQFDIQKIAKYNEQDLQRLRNDPGIIRNTLKINAVIYNANRILAIQESHTSFQQWLEAHVHLALPEWVKLFKKHFKFTGPEIVNEFLMSTGYLPGAHHPNCKMYPKVLEAKPAWHSCNPLS